MRRPTPPEAQAAFWEASLAGQRPPRYEGQAEPGLYRTRRVKGGPYLPVRIWLHQVVDPETGDLEEPERVRMSIAGQEVEGDLVQTGAQRIASLWGGCWPITREAYRALLAAHRSDPRMSDATTRIDLTRSPPRPERIAR